MTSPQVTEADRKRVKGCIWCDRLRKGDRKVKASRNPRLHWVALDRGKWGQKQCAKVSR